MDFNSSSSSRKQEILSKARLDAAHDVYLDMVSDPSLNFSKKKKDKILSDVRSSSKSEEKSTSKSKSEIMTTTDQNSQKPSNENSRPVGHFVYNHQEAKKKPRASLFDPKYPPAKKGNQMRKARVDFIAEFYSPEREAERYMMQRQKEEELAKEKERMNRENTIKHTREAIKKYRCDKKRQKLTDDLKKIKDFELALQLDSMKKPTSHMNIPSQYMVEIRHQHVCDESSYFLTAATPPQPRKVTPKPIPQNP